MSFFFFTEIAEVPLLSEFLSGESAVSALRAQSWGRKSSTLRISTIDTRLQIIVAKCASAVKAYCFGILTCELILSSLLSAPSQPRLTSPLTPANCDWRNRVRGSVRGFSYRYVP